MSHTVWRQEHAGADFAQRFGLLVDGNADSPREQSVRGEQPSDSTAYDCDSQGLFQVVTFARWVRFNYEPKWTPIIAAGSRFYGSMIDAAWLIRV